MVTTADVQSITVFSEIGVALAGFGLLGSILSSRHGASHPELDAMRLRTLVNGSAVLALGGLLPLIISKFHLPISLIWRLSSLGFLGGLIWVGVVAFIQVRPLRKRRILAKTSVVMSLFLLQLSSWVPVIINTVYYKASIAQGLYMLSLGIHTGAGFVMFVRTFSSLFKKVEGNR